MDDQRVGRALRALRHRLGWRQQDVGDKAGVSQDVVSRAELGRVGQLTVDSLGRIAAALGADLVITVRWRGAELDRLIDEWHASLVGEVLKLLAEHGWDVRAEVSYSIWGERGSIDILAWHAPTRTLLVVEIKTELASLEETIRKLDAKVRLGPKVADERFGWQPLRIAHLLVLPAGSTPRRQVTRHAAVLDRVFPARGAAVRSWIAAPTGPIGGLLFVPVTHQVRSRNSRVTRKRVRLTSADGAEREPVPAKAGSYATYARGAW